MLHRSDCNSDFGIVLDTDKFHALTVQYQTHKSSQPEREKWNRRDGGVKIRLNCHLARVTDAPFRGTKPPISVGEWFLSNF